VALRGGQADEAVRLLAEVETQRPVVEGTANGTAFRGWRDLDDLTAGFLEVLTSNGKYYWVPFELVELLECRPPARPRDLLWRRARMVVRDGPDGEVYLPALYAGTHAEADDRLRLGRATDWRAGDGAPVRGRGQRMFLAGEDALSFQDLREVTFRPAPPRP
jgi:type VI secretion system protein ImpE